MPDYVNKITVKFFDTDNNGIDYGVFEIRYCPNCKLCKDKELFRSLHQNKEYNIWCRRCLNNVSKYQVKYRNSTLYN